MERAVALKKLRKILGKNFGYQLDPKAQAKEEREAAKIELTSAVAVRNNIQEKMEARRKAILAADVEYQKLSADYTTARACVDKLNAVVYRKKITVGTSNKLFFHVAADGDSWEEVLEKLSKKNVAA